MSEERVEKALMWRNLRNEEGQALALANKAWALCFTDKFLPAWMAGASENVEDVCVEELGTLRELDSAMYAESPIPFAKMQV
jgi:hypothetical protein